jgi:hypothetical protein
LLLFQLGVRLTRGIPTGNPIAAYRMHPVVGNHALYLAGYGPKGFTFVLYENDGELYLVKAKLP